MSYADLYLTSSPKIISPADDSEPVTTLFGIPFDSTHSYKPGCRFGPDAIRDTFNNIEIFMPEFGVEHANSYNLFRLCNLKPIGKYGYINGVKKWYFDAIYENC